MAKGIRVNQLAKELGVESKAILAKCRAENIDGITNHMSLLSVGLSETVREWFHHASGGVATAVETAAPVDVAINAKPKVSRSKKKRESSETDDGGGVATAEVPADEAPAHAEARTEAPVEEPETSTDVIAEVPAHPTTTEISEPAAAEVAPPPVAPVAPPAPVAAAPAAPAAPPVAPPAPSIAPRRVQPPQGAGAADIARVPVRPTITLGKPSQPVVERKAVTPAPKLVTPTPAQIQGPRVVREEKPDVVPVPKARPRPGTGSDQPPAFTQARPQGGRGVKVSEDNDEDGKKAAAKKGATLSSRRRGPDGRRGEAEEKLREFTEADLIERRDRLNAASASRAEFDRHLKGAQQRGQHVQAKTAAQRGAPVTIEEPITVKTLSAALGIKSNDIIKKLMTQGVFASVNQSLDRDAAATIALEYGVELTVAEEVTQEEELLQEFESREVPAEDLLPRPPVVTILGHVDHGKTSLLDKIRNANVAAGEAGGITQHTAAWMVTLGEGEKTKRVTFIDTPGHQAFTSMRARGANMTDVVVLVVSAAEGVQPQTVESINHARAAGVPIVVALNKIDRPDANADMVLGQLAKEGLNPVEWGGEIEVVRTSATTGQGIKDLIEILDYQAELLELKADPKSPARGIVIESRMDPGLGSIATVLIQDGTLHVGDVALSGPGYGRIRNLMNDRGESITEAGPSTPVLVSGLSELPGSGDKFFVIDDFERARSIAEERTMQARQSQLASQGKVTLDNLFATMKAGDIKTINLIIKGDVQGSVETLTKTVTDQNTEEVRVRVIHSAVGGINESDVELADASSAVIIGFHVAPDESARAMAEQRHVEIRLYRVIYEIFDDLKKALSGMLEPEIREKLHGHAEVRQVFKVSRVGNIAGCMVTDGHIQRGSKMRIIRDGVIIVQDLAIETLRRGKEDSKEVKSGFECGIKLAGYDDIKIGDRLEAYVRETFQRTL